MACAFPSHRRQTAVPFANRAIRRTNWSIRCAAGGVGGCIRISRFPPLDTCFLKGLKRHANESGTTTETEPVVAILLPLLSNSISVFRNGKLAADSRDRHEHVNGHSADLASRSPARAINVITVFPPGVFSSCYTDRTISGPLAKFAPSVLHQRATALNRS